MSTKFCNFAVWKRAAGISLYDVASHLPAISRPVFIQPVVTPPMIMTEIKKLFRLIFLLRFRQISEQIFLHEEGAMRAS